MKVGDQFVMIMLLGGGFGVLGLKVMNGVNGYYYDGFEKKFQFCVIGSIVVWEFIQVEF